MPSFTPRDPRELEKNFIVLPEGEYDFEVRSATESRSKNGNDMIELKLAVFNAGQEVKTFDYLVFSQKAQWKLYSFCKAVGLVDRFKAGEITGFDCEGKSGRLKLKIDKSDGFDDRNAVAHYIEATGSSKVSVSKEDDDIPF